MGKRKRLKDERRIERRLTEIQAALSPRAVRLAGEPRPTPRISDRGISLVGLFLSLLAAGGQSLFPTLFAIWAGCFSIGIGGLLWALLNEGVFGLFLATRKGICLALIVLFTGIAFAAGWYRAQQLAEPPDISLIFVYPADASPLITNPTNKVVQQPKYEVAIWNLDHPERSNPLPIPTQTGDFIRPHNAWGPNQMLDLPHVRPLVSAGEHLFGFAQALCSDCKRNHYYWVYIEHGKGGWYCELPVGQLVNWNVLFERIGQIAKARDTWVNELAPPACRRPIESWP